LAQVGAMQSCRGRLLYKLGLCRIVMVDGDVSLLTKCHQVEVDEATPHAELRARSFPSRSGCLWPTLDWRGSSRYGLVVVITGSHRHCGASWSKIG
jgi:hypothetical protein